MAGTHGHTSVRIILACMLCHTMCLVECVDLLVRSLASLRSDLFVTSKVISVDGPGGIEASLFLTTP